MVIKTDVANIYIATYNGQNLAIIIPMLPRELPSIGPIQDDMWGLKSEPTSMQAFESALSLANARIQMFLQKTPEAMSDPNRILFH